MKHLIFAVLTILILPAYTLADEIHALDGNSYVVQVQKSGEELYQNENLEFESGNFETTFMEDKGFSKGSYSSHKDGEKHKWSATLKNQSGQALIWDGVESEGKVEGTIISKPSGTTYSFKSEPRG